MDGALFEAFSEWASNSCVSLLNHGWTVTLEEFEDGDQIVLELESRKFIGRFVLADTGHVEIGIRNKRNGEIRRGACAVYTTAQLEDAVNQFLGWISGKPEEDPRINCPHKKRVFDSRHAAEEALKRIFARPGARRTLHSYKCHLCHQWHIGGIQGRIEMVRRTITKAPKRTPRRRPRP